MNITYRPARKADCYRLAELDAIASGGAVEFLFHDLIPDATATDVVCYGFEQDQPPHTFRNVIVAENEGNIIGMSLSFPASQFGISDEMKNFIPADRLEHFKTFFSSRIEGSYLLDAMCVDETFRRKGIGYKLMQHTMGKAKNEGYTVLSLIVFADNTKAINFYQNQGFTTVKHIELAKHPLMPHDGGCLLMKVDI